MFGNIAVPQRDSDPEYDSNLRALSDEEAEIEAERHEYFKEVKDTMDEDEESDDEEYETRQQDEEVAYEDTTKYLGRPFESRAKRAKDSSDKDDDGTSAKCEVRIPPKRCGEMPLLVSPVLSKQSAVCANPASLDANMEHFRNCMLLESICVEPKEEEELCEARATRCSEPVEEKWYTVARPRTQRRAEEVEYDGLALCVLHRLSHLLDKLPDKESTVTAAKDCIDEVLKSNFQHLPEPWRGLTIELHVPMQKLLDETDDRDGLMTVHSTTFYVNEQLILKQGRNSWRRTDDTYRLLHTRMKIELDNKQVLKFLYSNGKPNMSISQPGDRHIYFKSGEVPIQEFNELLDFSQYTEREIAEASPDNYVPMKTLQLIALAEKKSEDWEERIVAILKHVGQKIRYDEGKWWCFVPMEGWLRDDDDINVKNAVKAAATDLKVNLSCLTSLTNYQDWWKLALRRFDTCIAGPKPLLEVDWEDSERDLQDHMKKAKHCNIVPLSERGFSSFLSNLRPWVTEPGFAQSFERCKDIAFNNCVQQMVPPFACRTETPADRVTNRFDCDLPPSGDAQKVALKPFLDTFLELDVALREADKLACLLTGTCATMPEANIRVQVGPYNALAAMYAGRVGKDAIGNHMKSLFGRSLSTDWGMAMLSATIEPDKNNPGFEGLEYHLAHWMTDGSARKRDSSEDLRKWGDIPKKIWAGGAPSHVQVMLKHKNKKSILPRSNAAYLSAQRFNIGNDCATWDRIECSPYPRVGNTPENQPLIETGTPSFVIDPNFVNEATNMDRNTRGIHMRYLVDRAVAILVNPKAAHPVTDKHLAAKDKLREVAGGVGAGEKMSAEDAGEELADLIQDYLLPCPPKGMDSYVDSVDVVSQQRKFQIQTPRCFCLPKKPAANACSFQVSAFADIIKAKSPSVYAHFVPCGLRNKAIPNYTKLISGIQLYLGLEVTGRLVRAHNVGRNTLFGYTICQEKETECAISPSKRDSVDPSAVQSMKRVRGSNETEDTHNDGKINKRKAFSGSGDELREARDDDEESYDEPEEECEECEYEYE